MSMLHSFYCWGQAGVVLLSTLYFVTIGSESWRWLPVIWALFPLLNMFLFMKVPINELIAEDETPTPLKELFGMKIFYVLMLLMICAGASELAMSRWSSYFAESGLKVSKTAGDLGCSAGPGLVGIVSGDSGTLTKGLLAAVIFPAAMLILMLMLRSDNQEANNAHSQ